MNSNFSLSIMLKAQPLIHYPSNHDKLYYYLFSIVKKFYTPTILQESTYIDLSFGFQPDPARRGFNCTMVHFILILVCKIFEIQSSRTCKKFRRDETTAFEGVVLHERGQINFMSTLDNCFLKEEHSSSSTLLLEFIFLIVFLLFIIFLKI